MLNKLRLLVINVRTGTVLFLVCKYSFLYVKVALTVNERWPKSTQSKDQLLTYLTCNYHPSLMFIKPISSSLSFFKENLLSFPNHSLLCLMLNFLTTQADFLYPMMTQKKWFLNEIRVTLRSHPLHGMLWVSLWWCLFTVHRLRFMH